MNSNPAAESDATLSDPAAERDAEVEEIVTARWSELLDPDQLDALDRLTQVIGTAHEAMEYPTHNGKRLQLAGGDELPAYEAYCEVRNVAEAMNDVWNSLAKILGEPPTWQQRSH